MAIAVIFCDLKPALDKPQSGVGAKYGALRRSGVQISGRGARILRTVQMLGAKRWIVIREPFGCPEVQFAPTRAQQG